MASATPELPQIIAKTYATSSEDFLKPATIDLMLDSSEVTIELMTNLIFEEIGGQELISLSRHDMLNGQDVSYQPIRNMNRIALQYSPRSLVPLSGSSDEFFKNFAINIDEKLPTEEYSVGYFEDVTGDIVINLNNISQDEQVEIQVISSTRLFNDTIY
jgi:hypothetical protein